MHSNTIASYTHTALTHIVSPPDCIYVCCVFMCVLCVCACTCLCGDVAIYIASYMCMHVAVKALCTYQTLPQSVDHAW